MAAVGEPGPAVGAGSRVGPEGETGLAPRGCLWRHGCPWGFPVPSPSPARGYVGARDRRGLRSGCVRESETPCQEEGVGKSGRERRRERTGGRRARVTVERSGERARRRSEVREGAQVANPTPILARAPAASAPSAVLLFPPHLSGRRCPLHPRESSWCRPLSPPPTPRFRSPRRARGDASRSSSAGPFSPLPTASGAVGQIVPPPGPPSGRGVFAPVGGAARRRRRRWGWRAAAVPPPTALPCARSPRGLGPRHIRVRPQIRRGDPLNLSILVSGGKETNQDSLSNGE